MLLHDAHGLGGDRFLRLIGGRADVVGAVDARLLHDRIGELARGRRRLARRRRRGRRAAAVADRRAQRRLIDDSARAVLMTKLPGASFDEHVAR